MTGSSKRKLVGAVMLLSLIAIAGGSSVAIWHSLQDPKDHYFIRLTDSVSGLELGSLVKMRGVQVGQVSAISIGKDVESVIITVALKPGTPVPNDTHAILTSIGITGLMFVELTGGTASAPRIEPNTRRSIIKTGTSTFESLRVRMHAIGVKLNLLLKNVAAFSSDRTRLGVARFNESLSRLTRSIQELDVGPRRRKRISRNLDSVKARLKKIKSGVAHMARVNKKNSRIVSESGREAASLLDRALGRIDLGPLQRTVAATALAIRRRGNTTSFDRVSRNMASASTQAAAVAKELESAMSTRSREWRGIKKNLWKAGVFLGQLARKVGK